MQKSNLRTQLALHLDTNAIILTRGNIFIIKNKKLIYKEEII